MKKQLMTLLGVFTLISFMPRTARGAEEASAPTKEARLEQAVSELLDVSPADCKKAMTAAREGKWDKFWSYYPRSKWPLLRVAKSEGGFTPLMYAAQEGNVEQVQKLLEAKVPVNAVSNSLTETALQMAANGHPGTREGEYVKIIDLLVQNGATVDYRSKNYQKYSALDFAAKAGLPRRFNALLRHNAQVTANTWDVAIYGYFYNLSNHSLEDTYLNILRYIARQKWLTPDKMFQTYMKTIKDERAHRGDYWLEYRRLRIILLAGFASSHTQAEINQFLNHYNFIQEKISKTNVVSARYLTKFKQDPKAFAKKYKDGEGNFSLGED